MLFEFWLVACVVSRKRSNITRGGTVKTGVAGEGVGQTSPQENITRDVDMKYWKMGYLGFCLFLFRIDSCCLFLLFLLLFLFSFFCMFCVCLFCFCFLVCLAVVLLTCCVCLRCFCYVLVCFEASDFLSFS